LCGCVCVCVSARFSWCVCVCVRVLLCVFFGRHLRRVFAYALRPFVCQVCAYFPLFTRRVQSKQTTQHTQNTQTQHTHTHTDNTHTQTTRTQHAHNTHNTHTHRHIHADRQHTPDTTRAPSGFGRFGANTLLNQEAQLFAHALPCVAVGVCVCACVWLCVVPASGCVLCVCVCGCVWLCVCVCGCVCACVGLSVRACGCVRAWLRLWRFRSFVSAFVGLHARKQAGARADGCPYADLCTTCCAHAHTHKTHSSACVSACVCVRAGACYTGMHVRTCSTSGTCLRRTRNTHTQYAHSTRATR